MRIGAVTDSGVSLRTALYGLVAIPLLAFATALAMDTYLQFQASLEAAYQRAATLRAMSSKQAEDFIAHTRSSLQYVSEREMVRAFDPERCDPLLSEMPQLQPFIANVYTLNSNGKFICSASAMRADNLHSPPALTLMQSTDQSRDFIVGNAERGLIMDGWVLALVYMIRDEAGKYAGIVGASVDLLNFKPLIAQNETPPGTVVGIVNSSGIIIARSQDAERYVGTRITEENRNTIVTEQDGVYLGADLDGIPRIISFTNVANSNWYIFVLVDQAAEVAPLVRLAWYRVIIVAAIMMAMFAITAIVARRIARPVEEISETLSLVRSGDLGARARKYGPREVRQIAGELNAMLRARIQAEQAIRQNEERFRTAFQSSPDAMTITTLAEGRILEVNDSYTPMTGWTSEEVQGKTVCDIGIWRHAEERHKFTQPLQQFGVCRNLEAEFVTKDGRIVIGLVSAHIITLDGETCALSVVRDITLQKAAEQRIHQLSFSDELTGLPNRRLFIDRLGQAIVANSRHVRHGALLYIDIDDFKSINETLGHDQGDILIQKVSQQLKKCIQEGDTVARLGGDEFAIILEELSTNAQDAASRAEDVCECILNALSQPYAIGNESIQLTCCIGITLFGKQQEETIEPLKRAELAMYQAKATGRNVMRFFDPQMQAVVSARTAMEQSLRKAINDDQIKVHYQPQSSENSRITGVEALVRWNDPLRGLVSPVEFIPLAEASGLIVPLGQFVLDVVCEQLARWSQQPVFSNLTIAVNVSARQFHEDDFVEQVQSSLRRSGAKPQRLVLEITESVLVMNVDNVIAKMNALKGLGIGFSMDDFGTGYSSLSYLKKLPLDELKIDKGFIRDILVDPNDEAIARMVVALATSMGLSVIAEGVETHAQREMLAKIGCHRYQGYLFGRPVPIDELEKLLRSEQAESIL